MKICKAISMLFLFLFSAGLISAQQAPVTDLVIQLAENQNDIILNWTRPLNANLFQVYSDSVAFEVSEATHIGSTSDTIFTHVDAFEDYEKRFYAVVAVCSTPDGMVLVPAGPYSMGTDNQSWALPIHTVNVPAFNIDIYEVTNAQYKAFCDATSRAYPPNPGIYINYFTNPVYVNYPVVSVNWNDASAYATWAGKRLPTEAEWERAAKGNTDNRQWPWGDAWVGANANVFNNPADGYTYTSPVGNYPGGISPAGCYDMAGNVSEWCEDDWESNYTGAPTDGSAYIDDPRVPFRVVRSGSWNDTNPYSMCAIRSYSNPGNIYDRVGFRCAKTP